MSNEHDLVTRVSTMGASTVLPTSIAAAFGTRSLWHQTAGHLWASFPELHVHPFGLPHDDTVG